MGEKRKEKTTFIQVEAQIDYEKLEKTIVKAQKAAANDIDTPGVMLKTFLCVTFFSLGAILIILGLYCGKTFLLDQTEPLPLLLCGAYICAVVFLVFYGVGAIFISFEIKKIKDKIYIVGLFSAIISMTALIISMINMPK